MNKSKQVKQGEVWMINLSLDSIDHEQSGIRPCIVLQNNYLNITSDNVVIIPLTSQKKKKQPFHYNLYKENYPFFNKATNIVLSECITCVSKSRLERKIGMIFYKDLLGIFEALQYLWLEK
jgi:mRNA interferase MazF